MPACLAEAIAFLRVHRGIVPQMSLDLLVSCRRETTSCGLPASPKGPAEATAFPRALKGSDPQLSLGQVAPCRRETSSYGLSASFKGPAEATACLRVHRALHPVPPDSLRPCFAAKHSPQANSHVVKPMTSPKPAKKGLKPRL